MIDRDEITAKSDEFGIHSSNVQRDYVFGWLLNSLYATAPLADRLVLKGGNALRKAYFPLTRFSDDLDFTTSSGLDPDLLVQQFNEVCRLAEAESGVRFDVERNQIVGERMIDDKRRAYKMRLYFQDFTGNADHLTLRVKLDVTEFDRLYLPAQQRHLIHPYSDASECNGQIRVVKLEEALADKLSCLIQRRYSHDLFDLVYCVFVDRELDVNRGELVHTFLRKSMFAGSPLTARDLLIGVPFELLRGFWETMLCPRDSLIGFDRAIALARDGLRALFAPFNYGAHRVGAYFPSALRNPILQAATDLTLLRLAYHGQTRLVEPYALAFKQRRDGVAQEYFYAYDRTGGFSGPGIKSFVRQGIDAIDNTDRPFEPRYIVELAKSAGREGTGYFGSPFGNRQTYARPRLRRSAARSTRSTYKVQCTYCGKTFSRAKPSTRLNPHKDGYGNRCSGRVGVRVL